MQSRTHSLMRCDAMERGCTQYRDEMFLVAVKVAEKGAKKGAKYARRDLTVPFKHHSLGTPYTRVSRSL